MEKLFGIFSWKISFQCQEMNVFGITVDAEIKAKRKDIISELITFRITKAKAKVKLG